MRPGSEEKCSERRVLRIQSQTKRKRERKKKGNSLYTPSKKQRTPQGESECGEGTQRKRGIRKNVGVKKKGWRAPEKTEYRCMMYSIP